jgi:hypothetical protein
VGTAQRASGRRITGRREKRKIEKQQYNPTQNTPETHRKYDIYTFSTYTSQTPFYIKKRLDPTYRTEHYGRDRSIIEVVTAVCTGLVLHSTASYYANCTNLMLQCVHDPQMARGNLVKGFWQDVHGKNH